MDGTTSAYASNVLYAPHGQPASYLFGNGNGRTMAYNSRLQLSGFSDLANNSPSTPLWNAALTWGNSAGSNNGNLSQATYTHTGSGYASPLVFTDSYSYDGLNRLQMASEASGGTTEWSRGFSYDTFGNMWVSSPTGINPPGNTPQGNNYNGNNQISDGTYNYDAAGNQIFVNGNTLTYDAENRQVTNTSNATENYVYDGDGRRVQKWTSNSTTNYVYDAFGKLAAEYSTSTFTPECVTCYVSADHLGSTRLVTDGSGAVMARHDYLPFGEEIGAQAGRGTQFAAYDVVEQKFTGKERDQESGLDYFGARYYGSALGRWTSPDKVNLTDRRLESPTVTLNKYGYGGSNPLKYVDPDGEDITIFYEAGFPGHTVLLAYNQDTGQSGLRSFGPDHSQVGMAHTASGLPVPGTDRFELANVKSVDDLRQRFSSITIQTSPERPKKFLIRSLNIQMEITRRFGIIAQLHAPSYFATSENSTNIP